MKICITINEEFSSPADLAAFAVALSALRIGGYPVNAEPRVPAPVGTFATPQEAERIRAVVAPLAVLPGNPVGPTSYVVQNSPEQPVSAEVVETVEETAKRGRGRPKGSTVAKAPEAAPTPPPAPAAPAPATPPAAPASTLLPQVTPPAAAAAPAAPASAGGLTAIDVRKAILAFAAKDATGVMPLLTSMGYSGLSAIPPEKYAEVIERVNAETAKR